MKPLIVFDLDGTLVDSAAGVARYATAALHSQGLPGVVLEQDVGPQLAAMMSAASGLDVSDARLQQAVGACKKAYDPVCHEVCSLFPGVGDALELLAASFEVAVATNKRAGATLQILQAFKLAPFFGDRVFCAGDPGAITKGQALAYLKRARTAIFCAMVGDTQHDWQAAQEGSFEQFYAACWGARRAFGPSPGEGPDAELRVSASGPVIGFTNVQSFDQLAELALSAVDLRMVRHTTGA